MLILAAANTVGVVLYGVLYAVAGSGRLSQRAFLICLSILFPLVTTLWMRAERRHRHLDVLARMGRVAGAFAVVSIGIPVAVLMPLFWLDTRLPEDAGLRAILAPTMAVVLVSLVLVALTNIVGSIAASALGLKQCRRVG